MIIPATPKPSVSAASTTADDAAVEPDPTRADARYTNHIRIRGFGESPDKEMFVLLDFAHRGEARTRPLPLAGISTTSKECDRLNADGARLFSPQASSELIDRIQATVEAAPASPWPRASAGTAAARSSCRAG